MENVDPTQSLLVPALHSVHVVRNMAIGKRDMDWTMMKERSTKKSIVDLPVLTVGQAVNPVLAVAVGPHRQ